MSMLKVAGGARKCRLFQAVAGVLLAVGVSGCPAPTPDVDPESKAESETASEAELQNQPETVYTVVFDKNTGEAEASPSQLSVISPQTTLEELPAEPTRPGYKFMAWNTAHDGSGSVFTESTPVTSNLTVYAQWKPALYVKTQPSALTFSPMEMEEGESVPVSVVLSVVVSGTSSEVNQVTLDIAAEGEPKWLELDLADPNGQFSDGKKTFEITATYSVGDFTEAPTTLHLNLTKPEGYEYIGPLQVPVVVGTGEEAHPIPVSQDNIKTFNAHANTTEGRSLHYRLVENVVLEAPVPPETSNWTPIGRFLQYAAQYQQTEAFTGTFDGDNHTISGLVIYAPDDNHQGLFGYISYINSPNALIQNLGLIGGSVTGRNHVGSLVGEAWGCTIKNTYATGNITGNEYGSSVGGLVGSFRGTIQNSYATGNIEGYSDVGGLVGYLFGTGTIQNSYATGNVIGTRSGSNVGGLAGSINGIGRIQNSYATGNVEGYNAVGGLLGRAEGGSSSSVYNSYATGNVKSNGVAGGLVGDNMGYVINSAALNLSITTTGHPLLVGRVVGDSLRRHLSYNHARSDMDIRYGVNEDGSGGKPQAILDRADSVDGQSVGAGQYNNASFWVSLFVWNFEEHWQWGPNNLPILKDVGGKQNHKVP